MNPSCMILGRPALRDLSELWQALVSRYFSQPVAHSCRMATTLQVLCILQQELLHHLKCSGRFGTNKIS